MLTHKEDSRMTDRYVRLPDSKRIAIDLILDELDKAEAKHPDPWAYTKGEYDWLYAASVVGEEAGELVKEAMTHQHEGKDMYEDMIKEAAQTGCTVIRFLTNSMKEQESARVRKYSTMDTFINKSMNLIGQIEMNDYQTKDTRHDLKMNDDYHKFKQFLNNLNSPHNENDEK